MACRELPVAELIDGLNMAIRAAATAVIVVTHQPLGDFRRPFANGGKGRVGQIVFPAHVLTFKLVIGLDILVEYDSDDGIFWDRPWLAQLLFGFERMVNG